MPPSAPGIVSTARTTRPTAAHRARPSSRRFAAFAGAVSLAVAAGCSTPQEPAGGATPPDRRSAVTGSATVYPLTIDNCGFTTTVAAAPERVLTIKSSTTELLLALGLGDKIVATAFPDGPVPASLARAAAAVPEVAAPLSTQVPGAEAVLELAPDFVYAGWESNLTADGAGDRSVLAGLGVATYVSPAACTSPGYQPDPLTFDEVFAEIGQVGEIFDVADAANRLVASQRAELDDVVPDERGLTALWYSSGSDIPYVGAGIGAPQMILDAVGLENVAERVRDTWTAFSWEKVVEANPDVIVLVDASWNTAESKIDRLESNPATADLPAVREQRYLRVPFAATEAGVRNVEAAADVRAQLARIP